ncbi:MAG: type II toxin-antitoxin system VapC family toxin [Planctomycetota bacterium]
MRFWDSSALIAVLDYEERGPGLSRLLEEDPGAVLWMLTPVEVRSGLSRRVRTGALDGAERELIRERFDRLRDTFSEVDAVPEVREGAQRLLDLHPLRAGDALQLAAAIVGARGMPEEFPFVTLDRRLAEAASREGFPVLPPLTGESRLGEMAPRVATRGRTRRAVAARSAGR